MQLHGRKIYQGMAWGEALVTSLGISFFGGVDPDTGIVVEKGHQLEGQSISGKVLVFPTGKGSTVGSYTLYRLKMNGVAPAASQVFTLGAFEVSAALAISVALLIRARDLLIGGLGLLLASRGVK